MNNLLFVFVLLVFLSTPSRSQLTDLADTPDEPLGDCYKAGSMGYTGKAHTTVDGQECIPWNDPDIKKNTHNGNWSTIRNVLLSEITALDGNASHNYCRNTKTWTDFKPWCYTARSRVLSINNFPFKPRHGVCRLPFCDYSHCVLPMNGGANTCALITGNITRWHFDPLTLKCEQFQFNGCHGNANNFLGFDECMQACPLCPGTSPSPINITHDGGTLAVTETDGTTHAKPNTTVVQLIYPSVPPVAIIRNGKIDICTDGLLFPRTRCAFKCDDGFEDLDVGTNRIQCLTDNDIGAKWNRDPSSVCRKPRCPESIDKGKLSAKVQSCERYRGDKCDIMCPRGYKGVSETVQCQKDLTYDLKFDEVCTKGFCPETIGKGGVSVSGCDLSVDAVCLYECPEGFRALSTNVTCQYDFTFGVRFEDICVKDGSSRCSRVIPNGMVDSKCRLDDGQVCGVWTCDGDYSTSSAISSVICKGGVWHVVNSGKGTFSINDLCERGGRLIAPVGYIECPKGEHLCANKLGCYSGAQACDGSIDCPDGSDENTCPSFGAVSNLDCHDDLSCGVDKVEEDTTSLWLILVAICILIVVVTIICTMYLIHKKKNQNRLKNLPDVAFVNPACDPNLYMEASGNASSTCEKDVEYMSVTDTTLVQRNVEYDPDTKPKFKTNFENETDDAYEHVESGLKRKPTWNENASPSGPTLPPRPTISASQRIREENQYMTAEELQNRNNSLAEGNPSGRPSFHFSGPEKHHSDQNESGKRERTTSQSSNRNGSRHPSGDGNFKFGGADDPEFTDLSKEPTNRNELNELNAADETYDTVAPNYFKFHDGKKHRANNGVLPTNQPSKTAPTPNSLTANDAPEPTSGNFKFSRYGNEKGELDANAATGIQVRPAGTTSESLSKTNAFSHGAVTVSTAAKSNGRLPPLKKRDVSPALDNSEQRGRAPKRRNSRQPLINGSSKNS